MTVNWTLSSLVDGCMHVYCPLSLQVTDGKWIVLINLMLSSVYADVMTIPFPLSFNKAKKS